MNLNKKFTLEIAKLAIKTRSVEIAKTPWQLVKGMMFRKPKPILFLMPKKQIWTFHTWFCLGKLDIYFIDGFKNITDTFLNVPPFQSVTSKKPANYVFECPAGWLH